MMILPNVFHIQICAALALIIIQLCGNPSGIVAQPPPGLQTGTVSGRERI